MTAARKTYPDETSGASLLELLDRQFAAQDCLPVGSSHAVPEALHKALVGPARHVLEGPKKGLRAQLIKLSYRIAGGRDAPPERLAHVLEVLHAGSLVIDDVEDESALRRGRPTLHRVVGPALAINTGNWLYFWAMEIVRELALDAARELEMYRQLVRTMNVAHWGQALDLHARVSELGPGEAADVARSISELKTGALMAFAARSGAIMAGAPGARADALARFGLRLGVTLQRFDDLGGLCTERMRDKGLEDLRHERVTWAWALLAARLQEQDYLRLVGQLRTKDAASLVALRKTLATHLAELGAVTELKQELRRTLHQLARDVTIPGEVLAQLADHLETLEVSYV